MIHVHRPNKERKLGAALIITVSISPLRLNILGTRMPVPSLTSKKNYFLETKLEVNYRGLDCGIERVSLTLKLLVHVPATSQETDPNQHDGTEQTRI